MKETLQDLESAFADWEALNDTLSDTPAKQTPTEAPLTALQQDVRAKTKKLLSQLRKQLAELED